MNKPPRIDVDQLMPQMVEQFLHAGVPQCAALGVKVLKLGRDEAIMALPYNADFVGDPATGVLHGGVVTTLIDTVSGMAVMGATGLPVGIATLDLRIDYLKPARAHAELHAAAYCYKLTSSIAFVRARAYHPDAPEDLVASCVGAFMLAANDGKPNEKATG